MKLYNKFMLAAIFIGTCSYLISGTTDFYKSGSAAAPANTSEVPNHLLKKMEAFHAAVKKYQDNAKEVPMQMGPMIGGRQGTVDAWLKNERRAITNIVESMNKKQKEEAINYLSKNDIDYNLMLSRSQAEDAQN